MRYIDDIPKETLSGARVLLRASLNVPVVDGVVTDTFRIARALLSLRYLKDAGAKVIVLAHIGREPHETLAPVATALAHEIPLTFVPETLGEEARAVIENMAAGDIVLLENVRQDARERDNDMEFARSLAALGDMYVSDAFAVSHRAHASLVSLPQLLPSYGGVVLREEIEYLSRALNPHEPSLAILGGAKFATKEPLIEKLVAVYDSLFIGGALANDIFRAKGYEVGRSLVSEKEPAKEALFHEKVIAPVDVIVERRDGTAHTIAADAVSADEKIVDIGPRSLEKLVPHINAAGTVLWNGPMGLYEGGFDAQTIGFARAIAASSAQSIVGGGDTIAAIHDEGLQSEFDFLSTGGGAMLDFLLHGTLPAIEALR